MPPIGKLKRSCQVLEYRALDGSILGTCAGRHPSVKNRNRVGFHGRTGERARNIGSIHNTPEVFDVPSPLPPWQTSFSQHPSGPSLYTNNQPFPRQPNSPVPTIETVAYHPIRPSQSNVLAQTLTEMILGCQRKKIAGLLGRGSASVPESSGCMPTNPPVRLKRKEGGTWMVELGEEFLAHRQHCGVLRRDGRAR
jgi:hypothetical protein